MIDKLVDNIMKDIETEEKEKTIIVSSGSKSNTTRMRHYSRDDFSSSEGYVISLIQKNNPKFSSARFKQNAYACFRKIQFALVKEDPNIFRPFVTDNLYNYLNAIIIATKKTDYIHILEQFVANPMFLSNYLVKDDEERLGFHVTVGFRDYYKKRDVYRDNDFQNKPNILSSYYLEFVKKKGVEYGDEIVANNCPSCGAPLKIDVNGECEYCKKLVTKGEYCWILDILCYWDERFLFRWD